MHIWTKSLWIIKSKIKRRMNSVVYSDVGAMIVSVQIDELMHGLTNMADLARSYCFRINWCVIGIADKLVCNS